MLHKSCPAQIKAAGSDDGLEEGQFRALVSVFGNKDSYGDIVQPGAFTDTLAEWKASGNFIPVYWSHRMDDPDFNIGYVVDAKETAEGLEVLAQLDLDEGSSSKAKQTYRLLKGRRVVQFSFAYSVADGGYVDKDDDSYYEIRKANLYEVGPTPVGANDQTELLGVKHAADHAQVLASDVKAGRLLDTKSSDTLRAAVESLEDSTAQLKSVLAEHDASEANDQEKASAAPVEAKDEEPAGAKSEEPPVQPSVDTWATYIQLTELEATP